MSTTSTKEKILDSAEYFFAEEGYAGASMRSIAQRADVNLAAANYHFGSKEALLKAVFERRLTPLNRDRLDGLDALETDTPAGVPLELERLIAVFLAPALRMYRDDRAGGARFMRLMAHMFHAPNEQVRGVFYRQFEEIKTRFLVAFARTCPELDREEVFWRFVFMIGSMAHTMTMMHDLPRLTAGLEAPIGIDEMERRLIPFAAAGWRAPAGTTASKVGR